MNKIVVLKISNFVVALLSLVSAILFASAVFDPSEEYVMDLENPDEQEIWFDYNENNVRDAGEVFPSKQKIYERRRCVAANDNMFRYFVVGLVCSWIIVGFNFVVASMADSKYSAISKTTLIVCILQLMSSFYLFGTLRPWESLNRKRAHTFKVETGVLTADVETKIKTLLGSGEWKQGESGYSKEDSEVRVYSDKPTERVMIIHTKAEKWEQKLSGYEQIEDKTKPIFGGRIVDGEVEIIGYGTKDDLNKPIYEGGDDKSNPTHYTIYHSDYNTEKLCFPQSSDYDKHFIRFNALMWVVSSVFLMFVPFIIFGGVDTIQKQIIETRVRNRDAEIERLRKAGYRIEPLSEQSQ